MEKILQYSLRVFLMAMTFAFVVSCSDDDDGNSNPVTNPMDYKTPKYIFFLLEMV